MVPAHPENLQLIRIVKVWEASRSPAQGQGARAHLGMHRGAKDLKIICRALTQQMMSSLPALHWNYPEGDVRASCNSHRTEAAAGFLPWLVSKVSPPPLPPQALSNQLNHSDKYSRRKAAGSAWEERLELALRQRACFVLIATESRACI